MSIEVLGSAARTFVTNTRRGLLPAPAPAASDAAPQASREPARVDA